MAEKLMQLYKFASDKGGLDAKVKLATMTKIPSTKAATAPDSPETLALFRDCIKAITGEDPGDL